MPRLDETLLSPNQYAHSGGWRIIVIHATRGGQRIGTEYLATKNWFLTTASGVSSQLVIAQDARVARMVEDNRTAQHAGVHNPYSLGIELEQPSISVPFTDVQLRTCAEWVAHWCDKFGINKQHVNSAYYGNGILGHDETENGKHWGKSDPGYLFPWEYFIDLVNGVDTSYPQEDEMTPEERKRLEEAESKLSQLHWDYETLLIRHYVNISHDYFDGNSQPARASKGGKEGREEEVALARYRMGEYNETALEAINQIDAHLKAHPSGSGEGVTLEKVKELVDGARHHV